MPDKKIQIFVSSPGDVGEEREIAEQVIQRLQGQFGGAVEIRPYLWEHAPVRATQHVQEGIKPQEADIVVCMLWWRLGTRLPVEKFSKEDGTAYESGTEYEVDISIREYRKRGVPELLVYQKKNAPTFHGSMGLPAIAEMHEQKRKLDDFISRVFKTATGELKRGWKDFSAAAEFEILLEEDLAQLIREKLPAVLGAEEHPGVRWHKGSPFLGLKAFDAGDSDIFFGRTRAVSEVKDVLLRQEKHFLLILAASGTGKSSLLRAGVLHMITQPGVIPGVGLMRALVIRPSDSGGDLVGGLAGAVLEGVPELKKMGYGRVEDLARLLRESPGLVGTPLGAALKAAGEAEGVIADGQWPGVRLTIGIDQFEEIFTQTGVSDREREQYVAAIAGLVDSGWVWVIGTMRSDFYAHCASVPKLATMKQGLGLYELLRPTGAEIGQMIKKPAKAAGLRYEVKKETGEDLSDVIQAAAEAGKHTLPLLEFLLDELYELRNAEGMLTFDAYKTLHGLEGAITKRAEDEFELLSGEEKAAVPEVVRALITFRGGEQGLVGSRRVLMKELATTAARREVIARFVKARLLVQDRDERDEAIVGLAHESLLRHWGLVKQVVQEDMHFLRTRSRIAESMKQWVDEGKKGDGVLPEGKLLEEAGQLLGQRRGDLDGEMIDYVERSFQQHFLASLETGLHVDREFKRLKDSGCGEKCVETLREALGSKLVPVQSRAAELVGREGVKGLETLLVELAITANERGVRRAAIFSLARLDQVDTYDAIIGRLENGAERGRVLQALSYLLVASDQFELAGSFKERYWRLGLGVRVRVWWQARDIRLTEGWSAIPYIVIPAVVFSAGTAGVFKWFPGLLGWALCQSRESKGSGLFHGVTAGVIWAGFITMCLTLYSVVFRNARAKTSIVRPIGPIIFGGVGGLISGLAVMLVVVSVFEMDSLASMGWINSKVESQFGMQFWHDLFIGTRFGWAYAITGTGLGIGMAMTTNQIRAKKRLALFLEGRKRLTNFKQARGLVKDIFWFVLRYAWPIPAALTLAGALAFWLIRPGAGAFEFQRLNPEIPAGALKATTEGLLLGTAVDCASQVVGGFFAVVGIGLGLVIMSHGIQIQPRNDQR